MTIERKNTIDTIIEAAPSMAKLTDLGSAMSAAFFAAQDMLNEGDTEAALYLLKNHPTATQMAELMEAKGELDFGSVMNLLFGGMGL